jgi:hypothetical protein
VSSRLDAQADRPLEPPSQYQALLAAELQRAQEAEGKILRGEKLVDSDEDDDEFAPVGSSPEARAMDVDLAAKSLARSLTDAGSLHRSGQMPSQSRTSMTTVPTTRTTTASDRMRGKTTTKRPSCSATSAPRDVCVPMPSLRVSPSR